MHCCRDGGGKGQRGSLFSYIGQAVKSNETSYVDDKGNIYETTSSATATHSDGSGDQRLDDVHEQFIDNQLGELVDLLIKVGDDTHLHYLKMMYEY